MRKRVLAVLRSCPLNLALRNEFIVTVFGFFLSIKWSPILLFSLFYLLCCGQFGSFHIKKN